MPGLTPSLCSFPYPLHLSTSFHVKKKYEKISPEFYPFGLMKQSNIRNVLVALSFFFVYILRVAIFCGPGLVGRVHCGQLVPAVVAVWQFGKIIDIFFVGQPIAVNGEHFLLYFLYWGWSGNGGMPWLWFVFGGRFSSFEFFYHRKDMFNGKLGISNTGSWKN